MGNVLIFAALVLPVISGALHRPTWIIPTCAVLAVIGFFVAKPEDFDRLRKRGGWQMEYTIAAMLALGTLGCTITFTVGHLLSDVMSPP